MDYFFHEYHSGLRYFFWDSEKDCVFERFSEPVFDVWDFDFFFCVGIKDFYAS